MRTVAVLLGFLLPAVLGAQTEAPGAERPAPGDYRIGSKDLLKIQVYEVPELNVEQRVSDSGTISLPFIGEVRVAGYTQAQLVTELERQLEAEYVERATVTVTLLELRSRPITILGAVNRPGDLGLSGEWRLLEAIIAAGGFASGHGDEINVLRRAENGLTDQVRIRVEDLMTRADPKVNIPLYAGDLVNVERAEPGSIFLLGEVAAPGALEFRGSEGISFLAAIARAGGLTDRASPRVRIKRRTATGSEELEINYKRVLAGDDPDPMLQDGDILVVKESFF